MTASADPDGARRYAWARFFETDDALAFERQRTMYLVNELTSLVDLCLTDQHEAKRRARRLQQFISDHDVLGRSDG